MSFAQTHLLFILFVEGKYIDKNASYGYCVSKTWLIKVWVKLNGTTNRFQITHGIETHVKNTETSRYTVVKEVRTEKINITIAVILTNDVFMVFILYDFII